MVRSGKTGWLLFKWPPSYLPRLEQAEQERGADGRALSNWLCLPTWPAWLARLLKQVVVVVVAFTSSNSNSSSLNHFLLALEEAEAATQEAGRQAAAGQATGSLLYPAECELGEEACWKAGKTGWLAG